MQTLDDSAEVQNNSPSGFIYFSEVTPGTWALRESFIIKHDLNYLKDRLSLS